MSDDVGIIPDIPDDELDAGDTGFGPTTDDLLVEDEELAEVDLEGLEDDDLLAEEEDEELIPKVKKPDAFGEDNGEEVLLDEEEDDDEVDLYGDEDDEARYNYRVEEDSLEEGF